MGCTFRDRAELPVNSEMKPIFRCYTQVAFSRYSIVTSDGRNQANRGRTKPNKSWWIWTKPNEPGKTGETGRNRAKMGKKQAFSGKNGAKQGKKWAKPGKTGQKTGKNWQKTGERNRTLAKQGETESFAESWFGFGHPWSSPSNRVIPCEKSKKNITDFFFGFWL